LPELREIDLRGNPLTSLPQALADLPKLQKLDLGWITTLRFPAWIDDLEARGCACIGKPAQKCLVSNDRTRSSQKLRSPSVFHALRSRLVGHPEVAGALFTVGARSITQ
jgi:hypothetical protein